MDKSVVVKTRDFVMNLSILPYGVRHRIKYTMTANDEGDSRLLGHFDMDFETETATWIFIVCEDILKSIKYNTK